MLSIVVLYSVLMSSSNNNLNKTTHDRVFHMSVIVFFARLEVLFYLCQNNNQCIVMEMNRDD